MKVQPLWGLILAVALIVAPTVAQPRPVLVWNASPSVPVGSYLVTQDSPRVGALDTRSIIGHAAPLRPLQALR